MINFPESYFQDEIRCDFRVTKLMKHFWAGQLDTLEVLDQICKKHNLQYFVWDGSLIGAIRHRGYIPWDDDLDVAMKRSDYMKLMNIIKEELPDDYKIFSPYNDPTWGNTFARIANTNKLPVDEETKRKHHDCPFSVGIDIFPLDYVPRDKKLAQVQRDLLNLAWRMIANLMRKDAGVYTEEQIEQVHNECKESMLIFREFCSIPSMEGRSAVQVFTLIFEQLSILADDSTSDEIALFSTFSRYGYGAIHKKQWFDSTIYVPFEYGQVPVPVGYDAILQNRFGNYMKFVKFDGAHNYPCYTKQIRTLQKAGKWEDDEHCDPQDIGIIDKNEYLPEGEIPEEWKSLIEESKVSNKKIVEVQLNVTALCRWEEVYLKSLEESLEAFVNDGKVLVWWRPHIDENTPYKDIRLDLFQKYSDLVEKYQNTDGIIVDTTKDVIRAVNNCDYYLGEEGEMLELFKKRNKKTFCYNFRATKENVVVKDIYTYL